MVEKVSKCGSQIFLLKPCKTGFAKSFKVIKYHWIYLADEIKRINTEQLYKIESKSNDAELLCQIIAVTADN